MNRFSLFFLLIFCIPMALTGQDLEDQTFDWTSDIQSNLGLNIIDAQKTDIILNDYNDKLKKLIKEDSDEPEKSFRNQYELLKSARNKSLNKIFDKQQMTLFNKMEMGMVVNVKNYYASLVERLSGNETFASELQGYQEKNHVPVILEHKGKLEKNITEEDAIELNQLGKKFNKMLMATLEMERKTTKDESLKKLIKSTSQSNPGFKADWKRIKVLSKKYKHDIDAEYTSLDTYSSKWSAGIKSILQKYIPFEEQKELDGVFFMLNQYGISRRISQLSFLLFDKNDIASYFQIQSSAQELFLQRSL